MRGFVITGIAAAVAIAVSSPAVALMVAFKPPVQRAISSEMVVVGKVTAIEKDMVDATPFPNAPNKVAYKVAVVKIETALVGAENTTHIKIGFIPPPKPVVQPVDPNAPIRPFIRPRPNMMPELKEGTQMLFFLAKHPNGQFYVMPNMSPPVDIAGEQGKKEIESIKKIAAVLADPMKGLKSDVAAVRAETAAIMLSKYRSYPDFASEVEQKPIATDESKLILKVLADADWTKFDATGLPNAVSAFYSLGLTDKDGWVQPKIVNVPGQPPVNFNAVMKDAFVKWQAGPGKDYVIKRIAVKVKAEK